MSQADLDRIAARANRPGLPKPPDLSDTRPVPPGGLVIASKGVTQAVQSSGRVIGPRQGAPGRRHY